MSDVNEVRLVGNAGREAEVRYTGTGTPVANFTLATNEKWKDRSGVDQEKTEWHRCTAWGAVAEWCGANIHKGTRIEVHGAITTREWVNKDNVPQKTTEIKALRVGLEGAAQSPAPTRSNGAPGSAVFPSYGQAKGAPIAGASMKDLEYYANGARRTLADPGKAKYHEKERALLTAIEAEIARQSGGRRNVADYPPPPRGFEDEPGGARGTQDDDSDIPFSFIETRIDRA